MAAGLVAGALGTDTAGSVRIPAAFCGVTGIRPSTGLVPTRGWCRCPGRSTRSVHWRVAEDCALLLDVLADAPHDTGAGDPRALRIGVAETLFEGEIDARVARLAREALDVLREAGAAAVSLEPPYLEHAGLVQQALQFPEATSSHLEWLRTRAGEYGADVRGRLLAGLFVPATAYVRRSGSAA